MCVFKGLLWLLREEEWILGGQEWKSGAQWEAAPVSRREMMETWTRVETVEMGKCVLQIGITGFADG